MAYEDQLAALSGLAGLAIEVNRCGLWDEMGPRVLAAMDRTWREIAPRAGASDAARVRYIPETTYGSTPGTPMSAIPFSGSGMADTREADLIHRSLDSLATALGGEIHSAERLPDGSGVAVMSLPLPADHWLYAAGDNEPPCGMLTGTDDPRHNEMVRHVSAAARYAIRGATRNGREPDFDPDALVQNMVVGLLGYCTPDGRSAFDVPEGLEEGRPEADDRVRGLEKDDGGS